MVIAKPSATMRAETLSYGLITGKEARRSDSSEAAGHTPPADPKAWRSSSPSVGDMLTPQIRLIGPLGEGGMGRVWLAEHLGFDGHVAVKILRDQIAHEASAHERFKREAEAAARLESPHIVQVLDHGHTDHDLPYIAMELLHGETIQDRVECDGILPWWLVAEIVQQACAGLTVAHGAGIIHRDIKPDNLFIVAGSEPLVKILDFGIAREIDERVSRVTTTGNVVGTPLFMAPEQMSGMAVVAASDLWSLGVVIYYCLTGKLPYDGTNLAALALAIDRERPVPVSHYNSAVPKGFDAWLGRVLAPRHEDRFASAKEMSEAFERFVLGGEETPAWQGGAAWLDTKLDETDKPKTIGGRFPAPKKPTGPTLLPTMKRPVVVRPQRASSAVLAIATSALVSALGIVVMYAGGRADATPSVARAEERAATLASSRADSEDVGADNELFEDYLRRVPEKSSKTTDKPQRRAAPATPPPDAATAEPQAPSASPSATSTQKPSRAHYRRDLGF